MPSGRPSAVALGALAAAAVLGLVVQLGEAVAILAGATLLVLDVVLLRWHRREPPGGREAALGVDDRILAAVAAAWVAVALLPMHDIGRQAASAAVRTLTLQTGAELAVFGAVGAGALVLLRTVVPWQPVGAALTVLPVWVLASAAWASSPPYALARAAEYVSLLLLAAVTAGIGRRSRPALERLLALTLRWFALTTAALVVAGLVLGPVFVVVTAANTDRFTWIGAHPTESGFMLGAALLVLLGTTSRRLQVPPWVRVAATAGLAVALYRNQTRTVLAGLLVAGLVLLALWVRDGAGAAWLTTYAAGAGAVTAVVFAWGAIWTYVLRDGDITRLTTLNGRTELWDVGLAALHGPLDWLLGLGYGATRTVFVGEFAFAGNAHNSLLGTLVSLGLIGVVVVIGALLRAGVALVTSGILGTDAGRVLLGLLLFSVVGAVSSDALAEPHVGLTVLFLSSAAALGWQRDPSHAHRGAPASVAAAR